MFQHPFILVINSSLSPISHRLATIHPWPTERQKNEHSCLFKNKHTLTIDALYRIAVAHQKP